MNVLGLSTGRGNIQSNLIVKQIVALKQVIPNYTPPAHIAPTTDYTCVNCRSVVKLSAHAPVLCKHCSSRVVVKNRAHTPVSYSAV